MKKTIHSLLLVLAATVSSLTLAEEIAVPAGQQGNSHAQRPRHGLSMDQVTARFGAPDQQQPAVGNPPITRWVYSSFTVYFEGNHVIHSVLHASH